MKNKSADAKERENGTLRRKKQYSREKKRIYKKFTIFFGNNTDKTLKNQKMKKNTKKY